MGKGAPLRRAHAWARFALPTLRTSATRDSISSGYALKLRGIQPPRDPLESAGGPWAALADQRRRVPQPRPRAVARMERSEIRGRRVEGLANRSIEGSINPSPERKCGEAVSLSSECVSCTVGGAASVPSSLPPTSRDSLAPLGTIAINAGRPAPRGAKADFSPCPNCPFCLSGIPRLSAPELNRNSLASGSLVILAR